MSGVPSGESSATRWNRSVGPVRRLGAGGGSVGATASGGRRNGAGTGERGGRHWGRGTGAAGGSGVASSSMDSDSTWWRVTGRADLRVVWAAGHVCGRQVRLAVRTLPQAGRSRTLHLLVRRTVGLRQHQIVPYTRPLPCTRPLPYAPPGAWYGSDRPKKWLTDTFFRNSSRCSASSPTRRATCSSSSDTREVWEASAVTRLYTRIRSPTPLWVCIKRAGVY